MFVDLYNFLGVAFLLFFIGLSGIIFNRKNIIFILMSIELILLAVNLNFVIFSVLLDDLLGQFYAILILTVAAAESVIGLAILIVYFKLRNNISLEKINLLRG